MSVAQILATKGRDVVTTSPDRTLLEVAQIMSGRGIGAIVITGADHTVSGILSERDIMRIIAQRGAGALQERVSSHMTRDVITASERETVHRVMEVMTRGRFRHMPVVHEGRLAGMISIGDLIKHRLTEMESEQEALKAYISSP